MGRLAGLIQVAGMAAVTVGVWFWSVPAGLVVGGVLAVVAGTAVEAGSRRGN